MPELSRIVEGLYRPFRRRTRPGAMPGTVVHDPEAPKPVIHVFSYDADEFEEQTVDDPDCIRRFLGKRRVTWVNVDGLGDSALIKEIGEIFDLHPLTLEDVVNVHQRAKVEDYDDTLFIVARMIELGERLATEQIGLFLGKNFVVTFQEHTGDCLQLLRQRIRKKRGRVRREGADYLAYSLLDAVIDGYFPILEEYGDRMDHLEEDISDGSNHETVARIHHMKHDLLFLRRMIWPLRDAVNSLLRDSNPLISDRTRLYLRDCYDHTVQLVDVVEVYREVCTDLRDLYLSTISTRTNETMKVLTIIATIFIPLGFIAGVYGMNFEHMPELQWQYGYPMSLSVMGLVAALLLFFFWWKGWL